MKLATWEGAGYLYGTQETHLLFRFAAPPEIEPAALELKGGRVRPGDLIRGLFGPKTSAGFENFHPVAPDCLRYLGQYADGEGRLALCERPGKAARLTEGLIYYGWFYLGGGELLALSTGGGGRVIQTDHVFLNDNLPPAACIGDARYWKRLKGK